MIKKMKKLLFGIVGIMLFTAVHGQKTREKGEKFSRNSFYVEILGNAIPAAFCYEHIWTKNGVYNLGTSIGGGYLPINKLPIANGTFEVNNLLGRKKHLFEFGIGWVASYLEYKPDGRDNHFYTLFNSTVRFGYRFQPPKGGFFFRGGFVAHDNIIMFTDDAIQTFVWNFFFREHVNYSLLALSFGFTF